MGEGVQIAYDNGHIICGRTLGLKSVAHDMFSFALSGKAVSTFLSDILDIKQKKKDKSVSVLTEKNVSNIGMRSNYIL